MDLNAKAPMMTDADVSCSILEFDFSGIEAVLTGYYLYRHGFNEEGAKQYIRLARLGMHAAVTAIKLGTPVDLTLPDDELKPQLDHIKATAGADYDLSKRTVHANNFGMTTYGMTDKFPEFFPTLATAEEFQSYYYTLAPDLPRWHAALRTQAREHGFLGGLPLPDQPASIWHHPYGYRHWFWDVLGYKPTDEFTARKWLRDPLRAHRVVYLHGRAFKVSLGGDGNRVVAFYPQSTAAGRLKEAELDLFLDPADADYIGDAYFGRTPLLGPIHDSLVLHVPTRCVERLTEIVARVMQRPSLYLPIPEAWGWGSHLAIGVDAKIGKNWAEMEKLALPPIDASQPAAAWAGSDPQVLPREGEGEEDEWVLLKRTVA